MVRYINSASYKLKNQRPYKKNRITPMRFFLVKVNKASLLFLCNRTKTIFFQKSRKILAFFLSI